MPVQSSPIKKTAGTVESATAMKTTKSASANISSSSSSTSRSSSKGKPSLPTAALAGGRVRANTRHDGMLPGTKATQPAYVSRVQVQAAQATAHAQVRASSSTNMSRGRSSSEKQDDGMGKDKDTGAFLVRWDHSPPPPPPVQFDSLDCNPNVLEERLHLAAKAAARHAAQDPLPVQPPSYSPLVFVNR